MGDADPPNLALALRYARAGIAVLPNHKDGRKYPYIEKWEVKGSTNAKTIKAWWAKWPNALVGLPTGARNGFAVLDIDTHKANENGFEGLQALGIEPEALSPVRAKTAGGGLHLYFAWPKGLGNTDEHLPKGVNVRGEGGYAIAPGTVLPDGRRYGESELIAKWRALPEWPAKELLINN